MIDWSRRRHPDDVPTPVAVAVADFCRRANAPCPPGQVREALAVLPESDDFRVRAFTDGEPKAQPLGPFAVVDMVLGVDPTLAARRQQTGYYELARALAEERSKSLPPPSAPRPQRADQERAGWQDAAGAETPKQAKAKAKKAKSVTEKIAPVKRKAGEAPAPAVVEEPPPPATAFLPKRELPAPRGRFTRLDTSRAPFDALLLPAFKSQLSDVIEQSGNRFSLLQALAIGYEGKRGSLTAADVEVAVDAHGLRARLERRERETLLSAVAEAKGALGRAAHAVGMSQPELERLIDALGLRKAVSEVRDGFTREALSPGHFTARLDMVGRSRYLQDLGIEDAFRAALERDVRAMFTEVGLRLDAEGGAAAVAREKGVPAELLERAVSWLLKPATEARR